MQIHLITDSTDAAVGMRLAGIDGTIVHSGDELKKSLETVSKKSEIGIVLITQGLYTKYASIVDEVKKNVTIPLITEIPESGEKFESDAITRYVSQAVGLG